MPQTLNNLIVQTKHNTNIIKTPLQKLNNNYEKKN